MAARRCLRADLAPFFKPTHSFSIEPAGCGEYVLLDHDLQSSVIVGDTPEDICQFAAEEMGIELQLIPEPDFDIMAELLAESRA